MAVENYAGATMVKSGLTVLGKVTATTFALTLGTAILAVVAGAMLAAQMMDFGIIEGQTSDEAKRRKEQM